MINPPGEDILDAPDLASLNLHPPPVQSLPPSLPYMVDEYLNQNTIAAAYQRKSPFRYPTLMYCYANFGLSRAQDSSRTCRSFILQDRFIPRSSMLFSW